MESKIQTEKITAKKEKISVTVEQIVENDMSLPDYYGDIVKILSCSCVTNLRTVGITGDKASADGSAEIKILYVNGEGRLEICECSYPFSRSVDVRDPSPSDTVFAEIVSEQITCRAVNQRRADIRGSVSVKITVFSSDESEIITDADNGFCHTLKSQASGSFFAGNIQKSFYLNDTADVEEGVKPSKIYRASAMPVVTDVKIIKNKMMIKGSASVDIVFLTADESFASRRVVIPVSQIIDMDGIDEETQCCVKLSAMSTDVKLTPDTPQASGKFEISLVLNAGVDAYRKQALSIVSEAYSPSCELLCEESSIKCVSSLAYVNENHTVTSKMDFSSCKGERILDVYAKKIKYSVIHEENCIVLKGNINFGIIVCTAENEKMYFERIADFEYKKQFNDKCEYCEFQPQIFVNAVNCSVSDNYSAVINTELHIDGFVYAGSSFGCVSSITEGKKTQRSTDDGVITIYFASKNERLWDIAKSHGSSVEYIKSANGLSDDTLADDCMLVFPLE